MDLTSWQLPDNEAAIKLVLNLEIIHKSKDFVKKHEIKLWMSLAFYMQCRHSL